MPKILELEPRYGLVAIVDALGTRRIWSRRNSAETIRKRVELRDYIEKVFVSFQAATRTSRGKSSKPVPKVRVEQRAQFVSDSIVITIIPEPGVDAVVLFSAVSDLLTALILQGIRDGVLLRGALACGMIYAGRSFVLGPVVDEAAEWSTLGDWAGIFLTPSAEEQFNRTVGECGGVPPFGYVRWPVPLREGSGSAHSLGELWAIGWPWYAYSLRSTVDLLFLEAPTSLAVERKRRHTMEFFDYLWSGKVSVQHPFLAKGTHPNFLSTSPELQKLFDETHKLRGAPAPEKRPGSNGSESRPHPGRTAREPRNRSPNR